MKDDEDALPFWDAENAHPRARALMTEDLFWERIAENAPFGSDEAFEAYHEWRAWRADHPEAPVMEIFDWILEDEAAAYDARLLTDVAIRAAAAGDGAHPSDHSFGAWTLDVTVFATALSQLLDEGRIDPQVKRLAGIATARQRHPVWAETGHTVFDPEMLDAIDRVVAAA